MSIYHPTVDKIKSILADSFVSFETFTHEEVTTSEEAAKTRPGFSLSQGAKALILKAVYKDKRMPDKFIMLVLPGDKKLDSKAAKKKLSLKELSFATGEQIHELTKGIKIGGIPPFGHLFGLTVYVDPQVFIHEKIVFNAGDRRFSIAMKSSDYQKLVPHTIFRFAIDGILKV